MLKFSPAQYAALSVAAERQFVEEVRHFLERGYPEAAGLDDEAGRESARALIAQAQACGIEDDAGILRWIAIWLDYLVHEPDAYRWAYELLDAADVPAAEKLLELEHRLYGTAKWA